MLEVIRATEKAIVEGVNMVKKHTKPNAKQPQGGIVEKEAPIHISNLMNKDPKNWETYSYWTEAWMIKVN